MPFLSMKRNFHELKKKVQSLTSASSENFLGKIGIMNSHLIAEFSWFEAMELLEDIKDAVHDDKDEKADV